MMHLCYLPDVGVAGPVGGFGGAVGDGGDFTCRSFSICSRNPSLLLAFNRGSFGIAGCLFVGSFCLFWFSNLSKWADRSSLLRFSSSGCLFAKSLYLCASTVFP